MSSNINIVDKLNPTCSNIQPKIQNDTIDSQILKNNRNITKSDQVSISFSNDIDNLNKYLMSINKLNNSNNYKNIYEKYQKINTKIDIHFQKNNDTQNILKKKLFLNLL